MSTWLWSCTASRYHTSFPLIGKPQLGTSHRDSKSHRSLGSLQALLPELVGRRMGTQGSLHQPGDQSSPGEQHLGVQQPCMAEEHPLQGSARRKQSSGGVGRRKQGGGWTDRLSLSPKQPRAPCMAHQGYMFQRWLSSLANKYQHVRKKAA